MSQLKTLLNDQDPQAFLMKVEDESKRQDCQVIIQMMEKITGEKPKMWGDSIIGFGKYHYKSERSTQEGDWPITAFSPRKLNLTVYIMPGFEKYADIMEKLGKYKTGKSCLYIKKLADIDQKLLYKLIEKSVEYMKEAYPKAQ